MKKWMALFSGLLALSVSTSALALELDVKYDADKSTLNLSGKAYAPVSVTVTASDASELSVAQSATVAAMQYDVRGETEIKETISLDASLPSGTYVLRARSNEQYMNVETKSDRLYGTTTDNKQLIETEFYHINNSDGTQLLDKINDVSNDSTSLFTLMSQGIIGSDSTSCIELLQIDEEEFQDCGAFVCEKIADTKQGEEFENIQEVKQLLTEYTVLYKASSSQNADSAISVLENNSEALGKENVDKYVSTLSSESKQKFFELSKSFDAKEGSLSEQIPELSALATIQAADRWQIIKKVITDTHKTILDIDYNVSNSDEVFKKMMSYTYTMFDDIADGFERAESEVNDSSYVSGGGGSSGGGGFSGGGGGGFEVAPPATEQRGEASPSKRFSDVDSAFWAYNQIKTLSDRGIISGYPNGTFLPDGYVTRAEFVKMLCTAFEIESQNFVVNFVDVSEFDWHYKYICAAFSNGLVNGISDVVFNPNGTITREDASTIVHRYLSSQNKLSGAVSEFSDSSDFADYSKTAIASLAGNGIVNGVGDGIFDAKGNITRAACAVLIYNCLNM